MSDKKSDQEKQPLHEWLPKMLLTFLVFLILAFVVYQTMTNTSERDLGARSMWALIVAMVLLVLLPVVDRIQEIDISPTGFKAKLTQTKAEALAEVGALVEDPRMAKSARAGILQAKNPDQVQAAMEKAIKLNVVRAVESVEEAIQGKRKCYVRYRPDPAKPIKSYYVAPLDIKPGKTQATQDNDYLWAYSYEHEEVVSLRLDRVLAVEQSEEAFDPVEVMAGWKKTPEWNVAREW